MTHSNTPWPAYDWTGKIVVVTGGAGLRSCIAEPASGRVICTERKSEVCLFTQKRRCRD